MNEDKEGEDTKEPDAPKEWPEIKEKPFDTHEQKFVV